MSFSRIWPSPGLQENQRVKSSSLNQLDIDHANSLDKTGDTITGTINIAGLAVLNVQSGGNITIDSGAALFVTAASSITGTSSIVTINNGIKFSTGGQLQGQSDGSIQLYVDETLAMDFLPTSLVFDPLVANPTFGQTVITTNSAAGQLLTLQAQNASGTGSTGGNLALSSGSGTAVNGDIDLQIGGTTFITIDGTSGISMFPNNVGNDFRYEPHQGSQNTQNGFNTVIPYFFTTSSLASHNIVTKTIPNGTCAIFEIFYIFRATSGSSACIGNKALVIASASGGSVSANIASVANVGSGGSATFDFNQLTVSGSAVTGGGTPQQISLSTPGSTNQLTFVATNPITSTQDWQVYINTVFC